MYELDELLLDVVTQVVSNSYEVSKETSVVVPSLAKEDSYDSSQYEKLVKFNVTQWLKENDDEGFESIKKDVEVKEYV